MGPGKASRGSKDRNWSRMRNCGLGWVESQEDLGFKGTHVESAGDSKK